MWSVLRADVGSRPSASLRPSEKRCEDLKKAAGERQPSGTTDGSSMVDRWRGRGVSQGNANGLRREGKDCTQERRSSDISQDT